jgi:ribosomal protein S18 acetylase RimI-like enzyme
MVTMSACGIKKSNFYTNESVNKMNQQTTGRFIATDKLDSPVIIEWQKTMLYAPEFAAAMKELWPLARAAYVPMEMQFLHRFPQVVGTEPYFKQFEPMFKNGLKSVDWSKVEEAMQALLKSHFIFDASTWGAEVKEQFGKDTIYLMVARDQKTKIARGFAAFMARPNYASGDIKLMYLPIDPARQGDELYKLLMSSIIKIVPGLKRISLHMRSTNESVLNAYRSWGFVADEHPIMDYPVNLEHWTFLEYSLKKSDILQKVAASLKTA